MAVLYGADLKLVQCSVIMTGNKAVKEGKCFGGALGADASAAGELGIAGRVAHIKPPHF
jgi:hypothetical protein